MCGESDVNHGADICTSQEESAEISMIGDRLREERERLGLNQPDFAAAAGAAKRTLIEWEKGSTSPTAVQLSALSKVGVDVLYVVTGSRPITSYGTSSLPAAATGGGTVTAFPVSESGGMTWQEVLVVVLDAIYTAKKVLPAKTVIALVDAAMAVQRAGIPVNKSAVVEQLRQVK